VYHWRQNDAKRLGRETGACPEISERFAAQNVAEIAKFWTMVAEFNLFFFCS